MQNLREKFVQARLSETPLFGQNNVEAWLAKERTANQPHLPDESTDLIVSQWLRIPRSDLLGWTDETSALALLVNNATPVGNFGIEQVTPKIGDWKQYAQLFRTHANGVRIFVGYSTYVIIEVGHRPYIMCIEQTLHGEGLVSRPFEINMSRSSMAIADVLLGEWHRRRHNANSARKILCDALDKSIARERMRAKHDFDTAVAVSADGTKIIKADWVVVVRKMKQEGKYRFMGFPGHVFHDQKIRSREVLARFTKEIGFPLDGARTAAEFVAKRYRDFATHDRDGIVGLSALFATESSLITTIDDERKKIRILVVREEDCPSLPTQGGEIVDIG